MAEKKEPAVHKEVENPVPTGENKSIPNLASETDETTFAKDYLAHMPDSKKIPEYVHESNKRDVLETALSRSLKPTSDVELSESKVVDAHNVHLVYTVKVVPNDVKHRKG